ncbi:MAG: ABC transporter permease [Clostridiales bacterium]|nr:ABC transporter permease [Clostridiales bacterium]
MPDITRTVASGHEQKVPLIRLVRRPTIEPRKALMIRGLALVLALITGGLLILLLGHNPFAVYAEMVNGAYGTKTALRETVKIAIPLLGAALAVALSFKMRFWNIGTEGQILIGGIAASYFALYHYSSIPSWLLILTMALAGMVAGGLWGMIPALFKAKWGTNETLFTLMFNYIALGIQKYLQNGPWRKEGTGFPIIDMFKTEARLPKLFGVHIGWIVVLLLVVLVYIYLNRSKQGYQLTVVGHSVNTAKYAGMPVGRVIIRTMLISGAIAGLVGFLQVSGADYTLTENTAGGVGFTAITVAWLSNLNPVIMIVFSIFIATLQKGANRIQTTFKIPASAADVLIGIILFFMLGCEFFINYRLVFRPKKGGQAVYGSAN